MLFSNKIILLVSNRVGELLSLFCYQAYLSSIWRKLKEKFSKLFSKWLIIFFVHAYGIQCLNQLLQVTGLTTGIKWSLKVAQVFSRRHEKRESLVTWEIFHINFQNKCSWWPLHTVCLNFKMALNQKQCFTIWFSRCFAMKQSHRVGVVCWCKKENWLFPSCLRGKVGLH